MTIHLKGAANAQLKKKNCDFNWKKAIIILKRSNFKVLSPHSLLPMVFVIKGM